jgi:hypothetical protein
MRTTFYAPRDRIQATNVKFCVWEKRRETSNAQLWEKSEPRQKKESEMNM